MAISLPFVMDNKARDRASGYKKRINDHFTVSIRFHFQVNLWIKYYTNAFFKKKTKIFQSCYKQPRTNETLGTVFIKKPLVRKESVTDGSKSGTAG
jgi:hypothetical protein